jgi:hypothetical protein
MSTKPILLRGGIHRQVDLANVCARIGKLDPAKAWSIDIAPRDALASLEQNSGVWKLYALIAATMGDRTARDVKRECKLCHGVPILRDADAEYRTAYDRVVKPLDYALKLEAMDFWPVTRLMRKSQKSAYLDEVQRQYGVYLERAA